MVSGTSEPTDYDFTATPFPGATYNWYVSNVLQQTGPSNVFSWYFPCNQTRSVKCNQVNACGTSAYSNSISKTGRCDHALTVSPNPSGTEVNVVFEDESQQTQLSEAVEITLLNSNQEKVYSIKTTNLKTKIPVNNLPEGTYFLNVVNKEGVIQRRVQIDR